MRFVSLACIGLAVMLTGCIDPGESTDDPVDTTWVQTDIAGTDLDGDSRVDIITLAVQQRASDLPVGVVRIHRQTGPGAFVVSQILVGRTPSRLRIADINGDSAPDLVVLDVIDNTGGSDDVLFVVLQDANNRGRFLAPLVVASGLAANDFVVTDANLDLADDIVAAGIPGGGTGAAQYLQRASNRGTFGPPMVLPVAGRVARVATGDVGASGRGDLVSYAVLDTSAAANAPGQLLVNYSTQLAGAGSETFFLMPGRVMASQVGLDAKAIAVVDVDANGLTDIVTCFTPISTAFEPRISVVLQRPLNQIEVVDTSIANLSGVDSFVIADLNGDGSPDVATTGSFLVGSPSTVRSRTNLLAPTVTGRYAQTAAIDMPVAMSRINVADVDGDGLNDLLLLGDSNRAYVMYQSFVLRGTFAAPRLL